MSLHVFRDFENPKFEKAIERIVSTCENHGVAPGLLAPIGPVETAINYGFRIISLGGDLSTLTQAVADRLRSARNDSAKKMPAYSHQ